MEINELIIEPQMNCSVKIMLSYDYNHFEVSLSKSNIQDVKEADELRKEAQRLADHAVLQFKIAKQNSEQRLNRKIEKDRLLREVETILQNHPKSEWTAEQRAKIKALEDNAYWSQYNYDYEDDRDDNC